MATKKKTSTDVLPGLPKGSLNEIELVYIIPDKNNPRKELSDLGELSDSLRQYGLLQPITVHCNDAGGFDLICGHRRYEAARLLGWEKIPAIVYPTLDADLVFELQVTENLQRKDINPMEESNAFAEIIRRRRGTPQSIADRLGKSTQYVYDRLALQHVIDEIQSALLSGHIGVKLAKKFARFTPADQEKLCESMGRRFDAAALDKAAEALQASLADATFDINDAELLPEAGACTKCPKRSGCNKLLFDDVQADDRCFDTTCYKTKVLAGIEVTKARLQAEGKKFRLIDAGWGGTEELIGRHDYDVVEDGEEVEGEIISGIVARVPPYPMPNGLKLGQVVSIIITGDEYKEGDEDDDNPIIDDDDNEPRKTGGIGVLTEKAPRIDHDEEINLRIVKELLNRECAGTLTIDWESYYRKQFAWAFKSLDDSWQRLICEHYGVTIEDTHLKNGWISEEGASDLIAKVLKKACPTGEGTMNFLAMLKAIDNLTPGYWDNDQLEDDDIVFWSELCDLPISAMVQQYCKDTGHCL